MAKINNFGIGLFVLSALVLTGVMLYALGMSDLFQRKAALSTFFSESVQGLAEGAQVKYKGARVGTVEKIMILPERRMIRVDMSVELDSFRNSDGTVLFPDDEKFYAFFNDCGGNNFSCCYGFDVCCSRVCCIRNYDLYFG